MNLKKTYDDLSKQGKYVCIASLVTLLNVMLTALHLSSKNKTLATLVSLLATYLLTSLVNIYLVNCMVKGKCEFIAWYSVYSLFIVQILVFIKIIKS